MQRDEVLTKLFRQWIARLRKQATTGYIEEWNAELHGGALMMQGAKELALQDVSEATKAGRELLIAAMTLKNLGAPKDVIMSIALKGME